MNAGVSNNDIHETNTLYWKHCVVFSIFCQNQIWEIYMKSLITFLLLAASFQSFATCALDEGSLSVVSDDYDHDGIEYLYTEVEDNGKIPFPAYLFSQYDSLGYFEAEECVDAVTESVIEDNKTGARYTAIYTIEDRCDGGNSYGLVLSEDKTKVLATINDGDFSCIK